MELFKFQGNTYKVVEASNGSCGNCVFKSGFGCELVEANPQDHRMCSGFYREDGRDVFFLKLND